FLSFVGGRGLTLLNVQPAADIAFATAASLVPPLLPPSTTASTTATTVTTPIAASPQKICLRRRSSSCGRAAPGAGRLPGGEPGRRGGGGVRVFFATGRTTLAASNAALCRAHRCLPATHGPGSRSGEGKSATCEFFDLTRDMTRP